MKTEDMEVLGGQTAKPRKIKAQSIQQLVPLCSIIMVHNSVAFGQFS